MKQLIMALCAVLLLAPPAMGAISFTNGFWSTSFGTENWTHTWPIVNPPASVNGVQVGQNECAWPGVDLSVCPPVGSEQIRLDANHPGGVPGTGAQVHYGWTGTDGLGGHNDMSGGMYIYFPIRLQEYWFRLYVYYPTNMGFGGDYSGWKNFYFDNDISDGWYFGFPATTSVTRFYIQGEDQMYVAAAGHGDNWFESNGRQGFGRWILLEIHFKENTKSPKRANGVIQVWADNELIIDHHAVIFPTDDGFHRILLGSNGDSFVGPPNAVVGARYDDIAIATPDYTGFILDSAGNPRIGPISGGGGGPTCSDTPSLCLSQLTCEAAGWYWCQDGCQASACPVIPPSAPAGLTVQ